MYSSTFGEQQLKLLFNQILTREGFLLEIVRGSKN